MSVRILSVRAVAAASFTLAALGGPWVRAAESLPPLKGGKAPRSLDELWGHYDPTKEPLETAVVREWHDGDATCRYVVFTLGTFKGRRARMAAFYAFPKSDGKLPALLHLHGGGQRASVHEVVFAARNGYAGLSINWGANPMEGMREDEPNTHWGALDATQTGHNSHYASLAPDGKTLDPVESPRNNNWFLLVLAARRGITFLARQPQVDAGRIGVHGHSMGGKLTADVAGIDRRVQAAVPSCGGSGSAPAWLSRRPGSGLRASRSPLHLATIDDRAYLPRIRCPILYLSPTNDFAGPLDCMVANWRHIGSQHVRYSISPHLNHRHLDSHAVCRVLWFEQWLKRRFTFPGTPALEVKLDAPDRVPLALITPDRSQPIEAVDIYYAVDPHVLTRFWRDARAQRRGEQWVGRCPILRVEQPLFVLANVTYRFARDVRKPRTGKPYDRRFTITSPMATVRPAELARARVRATDAPSRPIEDFARGWHDWFRLGWANPVHWVATTRKPKDPKWRGPDGARLLLDVRSARDNVFLFGFTFNNWGAFPGEPAGTFAAIKTLKGSADWQTVAVGIDELRPTKKPRPRDRRPANWRTLTELSLRCRSTVCSDGTTPELVESRWHGPRDFRNLRWEPTR